MPQIAMTHFLMFIFNACYISAFISMDKDPTYKDQSDCCEEKTLILIQKISGWVEKCSTTNTNLTNDIPVYVYIQTS